MPVALSEVAALAARAEVVWRDALGVAGAAPITPLVIDGDVVAALPFSRTSLAKALATATTAMLVCSDSRMAWRGWTPCAADVDVDVTADRSGQWTWTGALDQEVRKHPPARLLMDTAIQRREHWWYVPRWIVRLPARSDAFEIARRSAPHDGVLVLTGTAGALSVHCVAVDDWYGDTVSLTPLDATRAWTPAPPRDALLFTHDFSIPDQERWCTCSVQGTLDGRQLRVEGREGRPELAPPRLAERLRAHYRLERACRRALATYDASSAAAT